MEEENTEQEPKYRQIAATMYNSAIIDQQQNLYILGQGSSYINTNRDFSTKYYPTLVDIRSKLDKFYNVIHVSLGLQHIGIIAENSILKLMGKPRDAPDKAMTIINDMIDQIKKKQGFEKYDLLYEMAGDEINQETIRITSQEFTQHLIRLELINQDYVQNPDYGVFMDYFCSQQYVNVVEFFSHIYKDTLNRFVAIVWGLHRNGRLGIKKTQSAPLENQSQERSSASQEKEYFLSEHQIYIQQKKENSTQNQRVDIVRIECGHHHTLMLDQYGSVYACGMGGKGALGNGYLDDLEEPTQIQMLPWQKVRVKSIACGESHSMALSRQGSVFSWGTNAFGQLGTDSKNNSLSPIRIKHFQDNDIKIIEIKCGDQHSAAISESYELYTWGSGSFYRLGHGSKSDELKPKMVQVLQDVYVFDVSLGLTHSLCISNEGFVYGWGSPSGGQLGITQDLNQEFQLPTRVGLLKSSFRKKIYYQVACGTNHSIALSENGKVFVWGDQKNGVLGLGPLKPGVLSLKQIPQRMNRVYNIAGNETIQVRFFKCVTKSILKSQSVKINDFYQFNPEKNVLNTEQIQVDKKKQDQNMIPIPNVLLNQEYRISFAVAGERNSYFLSNTGQIFGCGSVKQGLLVMNPENTALIRQQKQQVLQLRNDEGLATGGGAINEGRSSVSGGNKQAPSRKSMSVGKSKQQCATGAHGRWQKKS